MLVLVAAAFTGCGGGGDAVPFTAAKGSESAYCDTYRRWQAHELDAGDPTTSPAALRAYWSDYLAFLDTALDQAPPVIREQEAVTVHAVRAVQTPVVKKYGFDLERLGREGTKAEQTGFGKPSPSVHEAQAAVDSYSGHVCGTESPSAADVVFKTAATPKSFCLANSRFFGGFDRWASSRFDPDVLRRFVTSDAFARDLDDLDATAPAEIAPDMHAVAEWFRTRWSDIAEQYDFDLRRILLDATPEDRAVFNRSHPEVIRHWSRASAYAQQVCSG
jgi:hypothetical protein